MLQLTLTEENYLKAIYNIEQRNTTGEVSVNEIAERMQTRPATVTDMLRKLSEKQLIHYEKYKKIHLSEPGMATALQIVRKHRLWETFLYSTLKFTWDEVHEVAEQLEHIHSVKLVDRLDEFLGFPKYDPHGDPIPNSSGDLPESSALLLSEADMDSICYIVAVNDTSSAYLHQLERLGLHIGTELVIKERMSYDKSLLVQIGRGQPIMLSEKIAMNILVKMGQKS